jgi:hypothetical protein
MESRDPVDIIEHFPSHVGGNHHTFGHRGTRPLLDWKKAVCVQTTAPDDKEDILYHFYKTETKINKPPD